MKEIPEYVGGDDDDHDIEHDVEHDLKEESNP
jgi:hypothetical protein